MWSQLSFFLITMKKKMSMYIKLFFRCEATSTEYQARPYHTPLKTCYHCLCFSLHIACWLLRHSISVYMVILAFFRYVPQCVQAFFFCVLCPFNILHTLAAIMATLQIRTNSELFGSFAGKFDVYLFFCVTSTKFLKMQNNAVRATDVFWRCTGCPVFIAMTATHDVLQFVCKF